eukprot:3921526-Rhodomonas_salina.1
MSGTHIASAATGLRACYAVSGTEMGWADDGTAGGGVARHQPICCVRYGAYHIGWYLLCGTESVSAYAPIPIPAYAYLHPPPSTYPHLSAYQRPYYLCLYLPMRISLATLVLTSAYGATAGT